MRASLRQSTANPVTALLAVQLFIIGADYVLTRVGVLGWTKIHGKAASPAAIDWGRFVVQHGLWTILLPGTLALWELLQAHGTDGRGTVLRKQLLAGLVVAVLLLLAFGYTAIGGVALLLVDYL